MTQPGKTGTRPVMVSLGDVAVDVYVSTENGTMAGSDAAGTVRLQAGGSAANVAVWLARLGAAASFIGAVGDDPAAALLRADLAREGVISHLLTVPLATAAIAVLLDEHGERTMVTDRGAAQELKPDFVNDAMLPTGCCLHLPAYSLFAPPLADAALVAAALTRQGGGRIGIDTSSVGPLRAYGRERFLALLERLQPNVLFANHAEAAFLSGTIEPGAGTAFLRRFAGVVVWKLGAEGAWARDGEEVRAPGYGVRALDTTGAGDAFAAACTWALVRDRPLSTALACANRLGAAVVQHIGARPRLPAAVLIGLDDM